jgi:glycosyltransferase involved in cell wall biosynthesis
MLNGADRDYARDRLGLPADRLSVIPNGISDDLAALPEVGAGSGGLLRIAFIGRWTTYKGRHTLVQTATRLCAEGLDFTVTIMGTGEERGVAEHFPPEIRDRITVIPVFANRELPLLLRDMDVFAFPTISEGSSLSLMEAMACGLAPVATAVGAAPDLIAHNDNGLLVAVDDPVGMAAAIAALARDRGRLDAMRRSAQRTAKALSWSHIGARTLALYREVLAARSA